MQRHLTIAETVRTLLDVRTDLKERVELFIRHIRSEIKENHHQVKRFLGAPITDFVGLTVKPMSPLSTFFQELKKAQMLSLAHCLESSYGQAAHDGHLFDSRYTEITLLRQSNMTLDKEGLVVFNFSQSEIFLTHYSSEDERAVLDPELRRLGECMNIHILAEIRRGDTSHKGYPNLKTPIIFKEINSEVGTATLDRDSSDLLKVRGLLFNKDYAIKLLRAIQVSQRMHHFFYKEIEAPKPVANIICEYAQSDLLPEEELIKNMSDKRPLFGI